MTKPQLGSIAAKQLRCEYHVNPLGIDIVKPRFSWVATSPKRDQRQWAYHIICASSPANLRVSNGDLWDTGKIRSSETAHIQYNGQPLASHQQCHWKVRLWDDEHRPSRWSKPALWTMGLLKPDDWNALWIGYDAPLKTTKTTKTKYGQLTLPPPRYLQKQFDITKPIRCATLYATAIGLYHLNINGQPLCDEYLNPGWTDYDIRTYYRTYDVTNHLQHGENTLDAILADGWYAGYYGLKHTRHLYGKYTRLRTMLRIELTDNSIQTIATDRSWNAAVGPLREADLLMGEHYDARRKVGPWQKVNTTKTVDTLLQAAPHPPVRAFAELKAESITEPRKGVYVVNLGRNFAGVARLKVKAPPGTKITLRYAERLKPDGSIYTANLRRARATDTYICKGGKVETWQPQFTFHGFQYVQIQGLPYKPRQDTLTGIAFSSNTPDAGTFRCNNKLANTLYRNIYWTQRANFIDIPTDCPQRDERLGWTGDAQIYIRSASYNNDVASFFTKWLTDLTDAQRENGAFTDVAPNRPELAAGIAAWGDAGVICPWNLYMVYGDKQILQKHYPAMAAWIHYCKNTCHKLIRPAKGFGDWLSIPLNSTPLDAMGTAYFAYSTKLMARIASVLGKKTDQTKYNQLFKHICSAFNKQFVEDDGTITGNTQTMYVLALAFDLLPKPMRQRAAAKLVSNIHHHSDHLSTGFVGTKDLMTTLTNIGCNDLAYRLFHNDTYPSWGFSIRQGATSIWERWNGWTPQHGFEDAGMNSFSHYSFGAVLEWMIKAIGGIDTDGPGYKHIIIHPRPGGKIRRASTSYNAICGLIKTAWRINDNDRFGLKVTIPANTTAAVYMPVGRSKKVTESGKSPSQSAGVKSSHLEAGHEVFQIGSGSFSFASRL